MLEPDHRILLLDALRPPAGYSFDQAVATSFTLDIHALLTTPLALAAFDHESTDGSIPSDPVVLLEALRRCADRIDLFCQAGEVGVPPAYHRLYAWVERSVHECRPPAEWAVFHPKLWVLRYRPLNLDSPRVYRLLCASRNLTFDRSWDVLATLDGVADNRRAANGGPVAALVRSLPGLAVRPVSSRRRASLRALATELELVRFTAPDDFDDAVVHVLGLGESSPLPATAQRLLVISPFVGADALDRLVSTAPRVEIIGRAEELDRLPRSTLERCAHRFVLAPAAVPNEADEERDHLIRPLVGLHAKVYVAEQGRQATWFVGSANATDAAFGGNIEVLVELRGTRAKVGIDVIYDGSNGQGLRRLLQEHVLPDAQIEPSSHDDLQRSIDSLRRQLASSPVMIAASATADGRHDLHLTGGVVPEIAGGSATIIARPLSLSTGRRVPPGELIDITYEGVAFESITAFVAFEIVARRDGDVATDMFVVRADLSGAPSDRFERLLVSLLANRRDVVRYLLFLLSDLDGLPIGWDVTDRDAHEQTSGGERGGVEMPLLETLLHSAARDPGKLGAVDRFTRSLTRTAAGRALLPDGFEDAWSAIRDAVDGMGAPR